MKRAFDFIMDGEKYVLKSTNPNYKKGEFNISIVNMQFDTSEFYKYIFEDINEEMDIQINDKVDDSDKVGKRLCKTITEIVNQVNEKLKEKDLLSK